MSQFSRRARWLNWLFPQSTAPRAKDPGRFSEEISLVQDYFGGGYAVPEAAVDAGSWYHQTVGPAATGGAVIILSVPVEQVFRLMAIQVNLVGVGGPEILVQLSPLGLGANREIVITQNLNLAAASTPRNLMPMMAGLDGAGNVIPILGPFTQLEGVWNAGDAADVITWDVYGVFAPLGAVFSI